MQRIKMIQKKIKQKVVNIVKVKVKNQKKRRKKGDGGGNIH